MQGLAITHVASGCGRERGVWVDTDGAAGALARKMAKDLQRKSPVLDNPEAIVRLLREREPSKKRGDLPGTAAEHAAAVDPGGGGLRRDDRHAAGASARGVQSRHRGQRRRHRARAQSSEQRPDTERGGHQGDARFDPGRPDC